MGNVVTLAAAGSRKTQDLVEYCANLQRDKTALVLTFTQANQAELRNRLAKYTRGHPGIAVMGWYTFLLRDFARPFVPFKFRNERVRSFNLEARPYRMAAGRNRYLDTNGAAYACELGRLAFELVEASGGALLRRLECIYDEILIDEVQDLSAYDWNLVDVLLNSSIHIRMVGDIRQAILATNPRGAKNKKYAYAECINWFKERQSKGLLKIVEKTTTWRCHTKIAEFSDGIFDQSWGFPQTQSLNTTETGHDGVFLVRTQHVGAYVNQFQPRCLRHSTNSAKSLDLDFLNFGLAKGLTYERVLVAPTSNISKFLQSKSSLEPLSASTFYVAVTRAAQSVAIVLDDPKHCTLPYWTPGNT